MKKLISYPLLLTTAIVLDRVLDSITQIDAVQSLQPLFVLLAGTFVSALLVQQFIKDWRRTDFIIFMVMIMLIVYGAIYDFFKATFSAQADVLGLLLIPLMICLYGFMVSKRIWKSIGNPAQLTGY